MNSLHGFWKSQRGKHSPVVSRPDLVAQRNADTLSIEPYAASAELEQHILDKAPEYQPTNTAPSSYAALLHWHRTGQSSDSVVYGDRIPVFDGGCEHTIYSEPRVNHAFRAWHDSTHLRLEAAFDEHGECEVATAHWRSVKNAGLSVADQSAIWFDTWGQYAYYLKHGAYIYNQALFVAACFKVGLNEAINYVW